MKTKTTILNTILLCVLATAGCSSLMPWADEMSWDDMRVERSPDAPLEESDPFVRVIQGKGNQGTAGGRFGDTGRRRKESAR